MHLGVGVRVGLVLGLEFVLVESKFRVRLRVRMPLGLESSAFKVRLSVDIDDLVLGL